MCQVARSMHRGYEEEYAYRVQMCKLVEVDLAKKSSAHMMIQRRAVINQKSEKWRSTGLNQNVATTEDIQSTRKNAVKGNRPMQSAPCRDATVFPLHSWSSLHFAYPQSSTHNSQSLSRSVAPCCPSSHTDSTWASSGVSGMLQSICVASVSVRSASCSNVRVNRTCVQVTPASDRMPRGDY